MPRPELGTIALPDQSELKLYGVAKRGPGFFALDQASQEFRRSEPIAESQVKTLIRESLLVGLRSHGAEKSGAESTMVSWAIAGAAFQWSREKKISADQLADAVLPTVQTSMQAGE